MKFFYYIFKFFRVFGWIASALGWGISKGKEFACVLQMLAGAAIMLIPSAYSFFTFLLPKTPAIFITFVGAVVGTWLFYMGLRQYRDHVPGKTPVNENEFVQRGKEIAQLEARVKQLQGMGLNVNSIKTLLSLNLLEIETHLRDFKKQEVAETVKPGMISDTRITNEYFGYIDEKIKVRYGVDLKKIRVHEENSKIVVSGIKCEYQGIREQDTVDEHYEIREKKVSAKESSDGNVEVYSHVIVQGDKNGLLLKSHKEHVAELKKKLNSGVDLTGLEGTSTFVENLGKEFIKNFFARTGIPIEFVDESVVGGCSLEEFVQRHNNKVVQVAKKMNERIKLLTVQ